MRSITRTAALRTRRSNGSIKATAKRYRYTGKERDEETGLYYHGARYYAPWLGRWISFDPLGLIDGPNGYIYARNRPTYLTDSNGMAATEEVLAEVESHQVREADILARTKAVVAAAEKAKQTYNQALNSLTRNNAQVQIGTEGKKIYTAATRKAQANVEFALGEIEKSQTILKNAQKQVKALQAEATLEHAKGVSLLKDVETNLDELSSYSNLTGESTESRFFDLRDPKVSSEYVSSQKLGMA